MDSLTPKPKDITLSCTVPADRANELRLAWKEILGGKTPRTQAIAEATDAIKDQAAQGLATILDALEKNPRAGQSRFLARFLLGLYNGQSYPFDLSDLRPLDDKLAGACVAYLNYDRLGIADLTRHLPDAGKRIEQLRERYGIYPAVELNSDLRARLRALEIRTGQAQNDLCSGVISDLVFQDESKRFRRLFSKVLTDKYRDDKDAGPPTVHACTAQLKEPLCGAPSEVWIVSGFFFEEITCDDCLIKLLNPPPPPPPKVRDE